VSATTATGRGPQGRAVARRLTPTMSPSRVLAALCAAALLTAPTGATPCAFVGGAELRVRIDAEEALIVWDAARRTEHFIRRADFRKERGGAFGFLVPTPTRPTLAEADEGVFSRLADLYTRPEPRRRALRSVGDDGADRVVVVQVTRVAGMSATVLRATDPAALAAWLQQHGFASRPGFAAWLSRYTSGTWHLTAFRYDGGPRPDFGARAVRLSFQTPRPFYPYAEPADQTQHPTRRLRVTVVAPARVRGIVGDAPWGARLGYADHPALQSVLRGAVPADLSVAGAWMTTFEEHPSRRGSADLFFDVDPAQAAVPASLARHLRVRVRRAPLSPGGVGGLRDIE